MSGNAWVTLVTNDSYALGALVLAHSLICANTKHNLVVLVTPGVTSSMRDHLKTIFNEVKEVNVLDSKDEANLALLSRPELGITFTKLHCWRLTHYSKCVFLDADTLVLQNCDELFDREELSAAPDAGWPDCFNSGVFVYTPSHDTFNALVQFAVSQGSFDGGDQGLLNQFFSDWASQDIGRHLPFIYNMCSSATYSYLPAYKQFGELVKIVHFIGPNKPWLLHFDTETRQVRPPPGVEHLHTLLQIWWDFFCDNVHPTLSPTMAGLAGAFAQMTLGVSRSSEQTALEEHMRKHAWEHGNADYMGVDSFDNIWKKICETLSTKDGEEESSALKNVSNSEPSSFSIENPSMVVKSNLEELTPATPLQVPSSSKQTSITPPIEPLENPQKPESIKVVLPIHPEMESTYKLQSQKTDEQQEQKKEPVLVSSPLPLVSHSSKDILSPSTPLVTEATPPTSPPIAPVAPKIDSQALAVETPPIETPPVSTDIPKFTAAKSTPESSLVESVKPSLAEQAPVPPKRRGAKGDSGKATVSQPSKGSKTGQKGKK
uniref:glycogenin glucosyltransferase n=1 Tax=Timema monikensis TaxID=170555 RepID=A0A7R9E673_9NEOP|nr:unnamed protein product [Timema monikensis]